MKKAPRSGPAIKVAIRVQSVSCSSPSQGKCTFTRPWCLGSFTLVTRPVTTPLIKPMCSLLHPGGEIGGVSAVAEGVGALGDDVGSGRVPRAGEALAEAEDLHVHPGAQI